MSGWAWAACSRGALLVYWPYYDAMLHTVFVGFVFAMIFGHAHIILPAILGRTTSPYQPALYVPLLLLHVSLLLRVVGDLLGWWPGRQWGGLLNALAVLLFLLTLARGLVMSQILSRRS